MDKVEKNRDKFFKAIVLISVFILFFISGSIIIGWNIKSLMFSYIFSSPDNIAMVYNTAICFSLMALCLLLLLNGNRLIVAILSMLVIAISLVPFLQNFFFLSVNIDQSIIHHFDWRLNQAPGQMSPNTSICFMLAAISFIILVFNHSVYSKICMLPILFGFTIIGLNLLYALGYVAQLPVLYNWGQFTSISPHTMIAFVTLAVGMISFTIHLCIVAHINYQKVVAGFIALATALAVIFLWCGLRLDQKRNIHYLLEMNAKNICNQLKHAVNQDIMLAAILGKGIDTIQDQGYIYQYLERYKKNYPYHNKFSVIAKNQAEKFNLKLINLNNNIVIIPGNDQEFYIVSMQNKNKIIMAVMKLDELLHYIYPDEMHKHYYIQIKADGKSIINTLPTIKKPEPWIINDTFYTANVRWDITLLPTKHMLLDLGNNPLPLIMLSLGLFMTVLLFFSLHFIYRNHRQLKRLNKYQSELLAAEKLAHLGCWSFSKEDNLLTLSDMAKDILAIDNSQVSFAEFIKKFDSESTMLIKDIFLNGKGEKEKPYILLVNGKVAMGKTIVIELLATSKDEEVKLHGIIQDISEFKSLERQLEHAQKMEIVGRLSGGIAHDFNNLLMIIQGNLELIGLTAQLDDKNRERIDSAVAAIDRSANLTKRLLAFSRMQMLKPEVIDVQSYFKSMASLLKPTLGDSITIKMNFSQDLADIKVDISQFETAIINLALNSRDAITGQGMFSIDCENVILGEEIKYKNYDIEPGEYVKISISDTGSGIAPEVLPHVFEPFFTTKPLYKGSGLGLSMLYGFIKQSKGHVTVYSQIGHGTTICLYLPSAKDQSNEELEHTAKAAPVYFEQKYKILVVEDEQSLMSMVNDYLTSLGHQVLTAENGDQAMTVLQQNPDIQILFTDVVMPGKLNGIELGERAKKQIPTIKVMYASGYAKAVLSENYELPSETYLLNKPYRMVDLADKIHELMKQ